MKVRFAAALALAALASLGCAAASPAANMTWHDGPVLRSHNVYTIYWAPTGFTFDAGYKDSVDGYFSNVSAALGNGATDNVYAVANQYCGAISLTSTTTCDFAGPRPAFAARADDTNPYPLSAAGRCTSDPKPSHTCLTTAQLTAEIQTVMDANGWAPGLASGIFILTPKNVDVCEVDGCSYDTGGTSDFCAFHSVFSRTTDAAQVIWATDPYISDNAGCSVPHSPNGTTADVALNTLSHEHVEMITDPITTDDTHPNGSGWYEDAAVSGGEIADKCPGFGTSLGSTAFGEYNQVINGAKYYLQQEWSNAISGCALTGAPPPRIPPVGPPGTPPATQPTTPPQPAAVVPASNRLSIKSIRSSARGTITLDVDTAGAGLVTADATTAQRAHLSKRRFVSYGTTRGTASRPGTVHLVIRPSKLAKRQLRKVRRGRKVGVSLAVTFFPTGGQPKAQAIHIKVKGQRKRKR